MTGRIADGFSFFSLRKFNVTLDCLCCQPIRTLIDSMRGNPDVIPLRSALLVCGHESFVSGPHLIGLQFLGPIRVHISNGISVVFVELMVVADRQTDRLWQ